MAVDITTLYPLGTDTTVDDDYGIVFDQTDDGGVRSRELYATPKHIINATWNSLYKEDATALRGLLLTYRNSEFSLTIHDVTYQGRLIGFPKTSWLGGNLQNVSAVFITEKV